MSESRRLNGLRTLRAVGLPTPHWQEVSSLEDIARLRLSARSFGWTIRTCRTDGLRETGSFFANNLSVPEVLEVLNERSNLFATGEFYIVYPSWKFVMSFNIVFDDATYIVEGKYGSQKEISDGTKNPEFSLRVSGRGPSETTVLIGNYTLAVERRVRRILSYLRRVPFPRFYSEVAITSAHQVIFYELFLIGSQLAGRDDIMLAPLTRKSIG